ncbi:hypothetical protein DRN94_003530 [archaeon]|nr:hypothetical protein [archaeon]
MIDRRTLLIFLLGVGIGVVIKKVLDPPELPMSKEEFIEMVSKGRMAREWAAAVCGGTGKEREECIEAMSRKFAEMMAERFYR